MNLWEIGFIVFVFVMAVVPMLGRALHQASKEKRERSRNRVGRVELR